MNVVYPKRGRMVDHAAGAGEHIPGWKGASGRNEGKRRKPVRRKEKKKREKKGERREGKQRCVQRGGTGGPIMCVDHSG